jgi:hypothetical protein
MDGTSGDGSHHTGAFIRCICSNQGKTPAKIIEKRICLFVTGIDKPLPKEPNLDIKIVDAEPYYLRSGDESTHDWTIVGDGQRAIGNVTVLYGVVKYRHLFSDVEVQTAFGYRIDNSGGLERLSGYAEYNRNR